MTTPTPDVDAFTVACPQCRQPAGHQCWWPGYGSQNFPHAPRVFRAQAAARAERDDEQPGAEQ